MLKRLTAFGFACAWAWAIGVGGANADWIFLDNFEALEIGTEINGQNGWFAEDDPSLEDTRQVTIDPADADNKMLDIYSGGSSDIALPIPEIGATSTAATLSARFYIPAVGTEEDPNDPDFQIGASSIFPPTVAQSSGPHTRIDHTGGGTYVVNLRNDADTVWLVGPTLAADTWYRIWQVINNDADSFGVYLQGGAFATPTQIDIGDQTEFLFRARNDDPLIAMAIRLNGNHESGNMFVDDFFVDTTGENLTVPVAPELKVLVHPDTGMMALANDLTISLEFDSYQIDSPAGALKPGDSDWNSLSDQDYDATGGGTGQSWDESGGSSATAIAERFLLGTTVLDPGESVSLGAAYDPGIGDAEMKLVFNDIGLNKLLLGDVQFIVPGDMDGNGSLEDADVNPFVQALTDRAGYDAANPGVFADIVGDFNGNGQLDLGDVAGFKAALAALPGASAAAVPEPGALSLVGLAFLGLGVQYRRKRA